MDQHLFWDYTVNMIVKSIARQTFVYTYRHSSVLSEEVQKVVATSLIQCLI